jgi:predicted dehydrogenase
MEILIIGLGSIAQKHVAAIQKLDVTVHFTALRSSKEGLNVEGIDNVYSLDEVKNKPEFVIICNPTVLHGTTIIEMSKWGVPLFIEKPSLFTLNEADTVLEALSKNKIPTYVAFNLRFHPCIQFLKKFLAERDLKINEVNAYCGSYLPEWRPGQDYRKNYSSQKSMGGGVHLDLIHELDYCHWLFGNPQKTTNSIGKKSNLEINVADFAHFTWEYPDFYLNCTLNYFRRDAKRTLELVCDNSTLTVDLLKAAVYDSHSGLLFEHKDFTMAETYEDQMKYFMDHLVKKQRFMNSFEDSLSVLKLALNF